jgi:hypothetical protein
MNNLIGRVASIVGVALAPMLYVAAVSTGVSSAQPPDCGPGNWWNPGANACQPVAPPPPDCGPGNWWNPGANACQPVAPPPPPDCGPGNWWNPGANACQPVAPPPPQ